MVPSTDRIHPTALIDPRAELAPDVQVGPFALIEGAVRLGAGCIVRARAHLIGRLTAGCDNDFGSGCVIGDRPQHINYRGEDTLLEIGDGNVFRENVTIHRGTTATGTTIIGHRNMFLVNAHVAHDCRVGDDCILANGALMAGHCELADRVFLSGNAAIHQFCRAGRASLLAGCSATNKDIPPFGLMAKHNRIYGVNIVGMRRAGFSAVEIQAVRAAYQILYRSGQLLRAAVAELERRFTHSPAVRELVAFIQTSKRGICGQHHFSSRIEEAA